MEGSQRMLVLNLASASLVKRNEHDYGVTKQSNEVTSNDVTSGTKQSNEVTSKEVTRNGKKS